MTASETTRGTVDRATGGTGTANVGNPGVLIGTQEVGGQPYARYRATNGTWVSASLQEQGYAALYGRNTGYGAYTGLVRSSDGTPLTNPDRIRPGQEYLVPTLRPAQPPPARIPANTRTIELLPDTEQDSRGTRNRYDAPSQQPGVTRPLEASAAPLLYPAARTAVSGLERAAAQWGTAEVVTGGGPALGLTLGAGVAAALTVGWSVYEWRRVFREWESVKEARADARHLLQQARRGAHQLWQNEVITDEEYFHYLATGTLVIQPERPPRRASAGGAASAATTESQKATDELWWRIMQLGNAYNRVRRFDNPFNEVYVEGKEDPYYILDAFNPGKLSKRGTRLGAEIISRKFTQFAQIDEATGIGYIREVVKKYKPGTKILKVPSSEGVLKVTPVLSGRMILSVPVQRHPIPQSVLQEAEKLGVTIRDDFGNEFAVDKPQQTSKVPPVYLKSTHGDADYPESDAGYPENAPKYIELDIPDTFL